MFKEQEAKPNRKAHLVNIKSMQPFELISIEYLQLGICKVQYKYLLVVADNFWKYAQAFSKKTSPVEQLQNFSSTNIFSISNFPIGFYILKVGNSTIKCLNDLKNLRALSNHRRPRTIQWQRTLRKIKRDNNKYIWKTLQEKYKSTWKDHIKRLAFAYNNTIRKQHILTNKL